MMIVIMLNAIMLSVNMQSVVMLCVVAPQHPTKTETTLTL
jgi:hypothetical protein